MHINWNTESQRWLSQKRKKKWKMRIVWGMFDYIKNTNTGIIGVSRKEKKERESSQNIFDKLMDGNFWNLNKKANSGTRSRKHFPKMRAARPIPRYSNYSHKVKDMGF